jgi:tetratricopeptide (TPR) repeat protein
VVDADPDYAEAKAWLGYLYGEEFHHRFNDRPDEYDALDRALKLGEQAVNLDKTNQATHGTLALTYFLRGDFEGGIIEARRAVDLNPRNALWLALMGLYLAQSGGDYENGIPMVREAAELSPDPPTWFSMAFFYDQYFHGRYEEALAETRLMDWDGDFRVPLFTIAALGQLSRIDEAAAAKEDLARLWPRPNAELRTELLVRHAFDPDLTELLMEGLIKAGVDGINGD